MLRKGFLVTSTTKPRRQPRHLTHDPLQIIRSSVPLHRGRRDLSASRSHGSDEIIAAVDESFERSLSESSALALLVKQGPFFMGDVLKRDIEQRPDDTMASNTLQEMASVIT